MERGHSSASCNLPSHVAMFVVKITPFLSNPSLFLLWLCGCMGLNIWQTHGAVKVKVLFELC